MTSRCSLFFAKLNSEHLEVTTVLSYAILENGYFIPRLKVEGNGLEDGIKAELQAILLESYSTTKTMFNSTTVVNAFARLFPDIMNDDITVDGLLTDIDPEQFAILMSKLVLDGVLDANQVKDYLDRFVQMRPSQGERVDIFNGIASYVENSDASEAAKAVLSYAVLENGVFQFQIKAGTEHTDKELADGILGVLTSGLSNGYDSAADRFDHTSREELILDVYGDLLPALIEAENLDAVNDIFAHLSTDDFSILMQDLIENGNLGEETANGVKDILNMFVASPNKDGSTKSSDEVAAIFNSIGAFIAKEGTPQNTKAILGYAVLQNDVYKSLNPEKIDEGVKQTLEDFYGYYYDIKDQFHPDMLAELVENGDTEMLEGILANLDDTQFQDVLQDLIDVAYDSPVLGTKTADTVQEIVRVYIQSRPDKEARVNSLNFFGEIVWQSETSPEMKAVLSYAVLENSIFNILEAEEGSGIERGLKEFLNGQLEDNFNDHEQVRLLFDPSFAPGRVPSKEGDAGDSEDQGDGDSNVIIDSEKVKEILESGDVYQLTRLLSDLSQQDMNALLIQLIEDEFMGANTANGIKELMAIYLDGFTNEADKVSAIHAFADLTAANNEDTPDKAKSVIAYAILENESYKSLEKENKLREGIDKFFKFSLYEYYDSAKHLFLTGMTIIENQFPSLTNDQIFDDDGHILSLLLDPKDIEEIADAVLALPETIDGVSRLEQILEVLDYFPPDKQLAFISALMTKLDKNDPIRDDLQRGLLAHIFIVAAAGEDGDENAPSNQIADVLGKFDNHILDEYGYDEDEVERHDKSNKWLASAFSYDGIFDLFDEEGVWYSYYPDAKDYDNLINSILDAAYYSYDEEDIYEDEYEGESSWDDVPDAHHESYDYERDRRHRRPPPQYGPPHRSPHYGRQRRPYPPQGYGQGYQPRHPRYSFQDYPQHGQYPGQYSAQGQYGGLGLGLGVLGLTGGIGDIGYGANSLSHMMTMGFLGSIGFGLNPMGTVSLNPFSTMMGGIPGGIFGGPRYY
ncbi:MAG: hypothetical protein AAF621_04740 [Pseudomonadota bacterium]